MHFSMLCHLMSLYLFSYYSLPFFVNLLPMTLSDTLISFRVCCFPSYFWSCNVHLVSSSVNQLLSFTFLEIIMLTHACNPSTESGGLMSLRPTWAMYRRTVPKYVKYHKTNKIGNQWRKGPFSYWTLTHNRLSISIFSSLILLFALSTQFSFFSLFCKWCFRPSLGTEYGEALRQSVPFSAGNDARHIMGI